MELSLSECIPLVVDTPGGVAPCCGAIRSSAAAGAAVAPGVRAAKLRHRNTGRGVVGGGVSSWLGRVCGVQHTPLIVNVPNGFGSASVRVWVCVSFCNNAPLQARGAVS